MSISAVQDYKSWSSNIFNVNKQEILSVNGNITVMVPIDCEKELEVYFVLEDVMMSRLIVNNDGICSVMFSRLI